MPLKIRISNLNRKRRINPKAIRKTALFVLRHMRVSDALIDITFVGNARIKTLNKKYMRRNRPSDVISFPLEERTNDRKSRLIGDIYISSDTAYTNVRRFETSFQRELSLYVIHGILHLLGLRDKTAREKNRIRSLEEKLLVKVTGGINSKY